MMLSMPPHFRKAGLHPTPRSYSRAIERLEKRQEIHINVLECRHAVGWKECEIPFHGPTAGVLEVDPAEPGRRKEVVACVRFAMQPLLGKGALVEPALQVCEGRTQECPVDWSQCRYPEVTE